MSALCLPLPSRNLVVSCGREVVTGMCQACTARHSLTAKTGKKRGRSRRCQPRHLTAMKTVALTTGRNRLEVTHSGARLHRHRTHSQLAICCHSSLARLEDVGQERFWRAVRSGGLEDRLIGMVKDRRVHTRAGRCVGTRLDEMAMRSDTRRGGQVVDATPSDVSVAQTGLGRCVPACGLPSPTPIPPGA